MQKLGKGRLPLCEDELKSELTLMAEVGFDLVLSQRQYHLNVKNVAMVSAKEFESYFLLARSHTCKQLDSVHAVVKFVFALYLDV